MSQQLGSRSKYANHIIVLVLLVISACLAEYFMRSPAALPPGPAAIRIDMIDSLNRFWGTQQNQVELTGPAPALQAQVRVAVAPGTSVRMQGWTFPLLRFVANRHPDVKLQGLAVTDSSSGQPVLETLADQAAGGAPAMGRARQAPAFAEVGYYEVAKSELLRRTGQSVLDRDLGQASTLLLVDVSAQGGPTAVQTAPNQDRVDPAMPHGPGMEARPEALAPPEETNSKQRAARSDNSIAPANSPRPFEVKQLLVYLVIQDPALAQRATEAVKSTLGWDQNRGDRLQLILLPKP